VTELELRRPELPTAADMNAAALYAERLANSGLLPKAYFKQPANVLYAIEYGRMIGLAPMAAITGVHVIEGKPSASAALISALVRRAGHKLRVRGDAKAATCKIVRADDPDFTFEVTYTIEDARSAKLTNKEVWQKYPASMLKARAITQCARDACEEALMGMHYTPEELGAEVDEDGELLTPQDAAEAVVRKEQRERQYVDAAPRNPIDPDFELAPMPGSASSRPATDAQLTKLVILVAEKRGIEGNDPVNRALRLEVLGDQVGRKLASGRDLTLREASDLIERMTLEPNYVADAEVVEDPEQSAQAEAARLAATDPESDPERVEADLRDLIESAGTPVELAEARRQAAAALTAGAIGGAAAKRLREAGGHKEDALKADAAWSRGVSRQMDAPQEAAA
jgi:hypothetical protein